MAALIEEKVGRKVIIAGSRYLNNYAAVCKAVDEFLDLHNETRISEVVSGGATGVDVLGEKWAGEHDIPIKRFPVSSIDWKLKGPAAGPIRNQKMADYVGKDGALVALLDANAKNGSPGTRSMIKAAEKAGLTVFVYDV